jgi:hypothetical protein
MKGRKPMKYFLNIRILMMTIFLLLLVLPAAAGERPFALKGTGRFRTTMYAGASHDPPPVNNRMDCNGHCRGWWDRV